MRFEEKSVEKNYVYKGKILSLRNDTVKLPNDTLAKREIVEHSGGACILCVKENKILLVKQFRYAYGKEVLEIPAGKLERGENPALAALRELEEECGVKAISSEKMFEIYPTPGYTNEVIHVYKVKEFTFTESHLDEGEFLTYDWYDENDVIKMINDGEINDAKTIIAVQKYLLDKKSQENF